MIQPVNHLSTTQPSYINWLIHQPAKQLPSVTPTISHPVLTVGLASSLQTEPVYASIGTTTPSCEASVVS